MTIFFHLIIEGTNCTAYKGSHPNPTTTVISSPETWVKISTGELEGAKSLMEGLYKIEDDMKILINMSEMFSDTEASNLKSEIKEEASQRMKKKKLAIGALDANMVGGCRGPTEYYLDWVVNYVKDYSIDCCIFPVHFACKHVFPITRITSEAVREETGVPSLIFGCDSHDSREVTSKVIREKISDFLTQVVQ